MRMYACILCLHVHSALLLLCFFVSAYFFCNMIHVSLLCLYFRPTVYVLKVAIIDWLMPFLAACHCAIFIVNLFVLLCTWEINNIALCQSSDTACTSCNVASHALMPRLPSRIMDADSILCDRTPIFDRTVQFLVAYKIRLTIIIFH